MKKINSKIILLILLFVIIGILPMIIQKPYILSIMIMTLFTACASMSWYVLGGFTGQNSLGHAGFMALGAYLSVVLLNNYGVSPWISMIIVFIVIGGFTAIILSPCFVLKGPYFSLVTIAFSEAFRNLITNSEFLGGGQGLLLPYESGSSLWLLRFKDKEPYFYIALIMTIIFLFAIYRIGKSKLGYAFKTIREDEDTARAIGINPLKYKVIATFISCGMIAVCGVFYANYIRFINADIMITSNSVEYLMPAVIGGLGSVAGPIVGSIILVPLAEYLNATLTNIASGANLLVYAIVLIAVIVFQPKGILGWFSKSKLKSKACLFFDKVDKKLKLKQE